MKLRRHAVSAHGRETPCATCRHTWAFRVPIWRLATLKVPQPRRPYRSPALQVPRKQHQGNYIRTLRHLEEAEVAEEDRQEQRDGRGATDSREHARHAARADRCARQLAAVLPSLLWQRMLLNLLWSSCSKCGTSAATRWSSSVTPQRSSWRYRSPVEAPRGPENIYRRLSSPASGNLQDPRSARGSASSDPRGTLATGRACHPRA